MTKKRSGLLSAVYITIVVLFLYSPIALLIYRSFDFGSNDVFSAYKDFFKNTEAKNALKNTMVIAVLSSCISTVIGTAAAVGISKYKNRRFKQAVMMVTNIPMTSPDIVTAISLVLLFGIVFTVFGVTNYLGFASLLIAHITFEIPYVILSVLPKINQMDVNLPQAAQDLGCKPFAAFFKVELPAISAGVWTGFFMAFTLSIDDFVISRITAGSYTTLPLLIYSAARKKVPDYIYALSAIIFVVVLVLLIVKNVISSRDAKKRVLNSKRSGKGKRISALVLSVIICASVFVLPASAEDDGGINRKFEGTTLTVFNWGEYIADGSDGSMDVIAEFEKETGIDVIYMTYANNEELLAALNNGGITYDIVVPSDYMFERLYIEGYLSPINYDNIPNYCNVADKYKGVFDSEELNACYVPYTIGMVGVIYNTDIVEETPTNWDILWDDKYAYQILMFDNPRDAFAISQFKLGLDINSTNDADWDKATEELMAQKSVVKRYVNDEIFDIMENGYAAVAPYYAGDFLTMKDSNDALEFCYPRDDNGELITNQFIDVMCITKASQNKEAAEMFINYILREDIALEVAEYICYASPNTTVVNNPDYSFNKENDEYCYNILYPEELDPNSDKGFNKKLVFRHLKTETLSKMESSWASVKAQVDATGIYITCIAILLVLAFLIAVKLQKKRSRRIDEEYYNIKNA